MGKQLVEMYDEAKKIGGLSAQIKLAILTRMPSTKALEAPDNEDNITSFRKALAAIRKEFVKN